MNRLRKLLDGGFHMKFSFDEINPEALKIALGERLFKQYMESRGERMICNKCGCNNERKTDGKCSMAGKTCIDGLDKYLDEHNLEICSTEWLAEHDKQIRAEVRAEYESADIPIIHGKEELAEHEKQVRADAIDDCIQWIVSKFSYIDELDVPRIRCNASTIEINMKEQLMQKGKENESD